MTTGTDSLAAPSADFLLGLLLGGLGSAVELETVERRGEGVVAVVVYSDALYRLQVDKLAVWVR